MPFKNPDVAKEYFKERHKKQYSPEKSKAYYEANKDKILKRSRGNHLRRAYNLTEEQYDEMVKAQNNLCAICNQPEYRIMKTKELKPLSVDHNHTTGKIRKLLCNDCNAAIGFAKEDVQRLKQMIDYLEIHND
jgi:hypothetical protein